MSYDLLFNLNENLEYVETEFQIDNNLNYTRQRGHLLIVFLFVVATRPLLRDEVMVEDHGAPEARQLPRTWTRGRRESSKSKRHKESITGQCRMR